MTSLMVRQEQLLVPFAHNKLNCVKMLLNCVKCRLIMLKHSESGRMEGKTWHGLGASYIQLNVVNYSRIRVFFNRVYSTCSGNIDSSANISFMALSACTRQCAETWTSWLCVCVHVG